MGIHELTRSADAIREAEHTVSKRLWLMITAMAFGLAFAVCGLLFAFTLELGPGLLCAGAALITVGSATSCYRVMER